MIGNDIQTGDRFTNKNHPEWGAFTVRAGRVGTMRECTGRAGSKMISEGELRGRWVRANYTATTPKRGADLAVGDVIRVVNTYRTIEGFDAHPGADGSPARVARFTDGPRSGMTVFDDDRCDVRVL